MYSYFNGYQAMPYLKEIATFCALRKQQQNPGFLNGTF